jgi:hypothetical protein
MEGKRENYLERMRYERSKKHKNWLQRQRIDAALQVVVIFGSASLPVLLNIHQVPVLIPTILSIVVTACAAMSKYFRFEEWGRIHRLSYRQLSNEIDDYEYMTGEYKGMSDDDAFDHFRHETALILDEHMQSVNTLRQKTPSEKSAASQPEPQVASSAKS